MTELNPPAAEKKKKSTLAKFVLPVILVIAGVAALGYFASKAGLDKALVKREVDAWIERSKQHAAAEGYELSITYSDVSIEGGLTDGHARISDMTIITVPTAEGKAGENSVTLTTAEVNLEPRSANLRNVDVVLPKPVRLFEGTNAHETIALSANEPLTFEVKQIDRRGKAYNRIAHSFPDVVELRLLAGKDAAGKEEETPDLTPRYDVLNIVLDGEGQVTTSNERSDIGDSELNLRNIVVTPVGHEEGTVKVAGFRSVWSNELNENNLNVINAELALEDVTANPEFLPYAPINANLKLHFEGAMPSTPEEFASIRTQQTAFKLSEFSFFTKDAGISATADMVASSEDILPVGMANLSLTNVQEWRKILKETNALNDKDEQVINTLFIRIAGETLPAAKDVSIDIQRAREGSFQIGHITFEELLAILMGQIKTPLDVKLPEKPAAVQESPVEEEPVATE